MAPIAVARDRAGGSQQPGKFSRQSTLNFPSCGGSSTSVTTDSNAPLDPLFLTSENMGYDCHHDIFLSSKNLIYPSPPSTEFQHPVALPAGESPSPPSAYVWSLPKPDQPAGGLVSFPSTTCYGGLLDSPLVMHHTALKSQAPLSPPPTQPTSTLALPPTDAFHDVTHAASSSSSCLSPILSAQCLSPILSGADSLDGTDPASSSYQSTSCLKSEGVDPLLSPLSPEWDSNSISHMQSTESPEHSYLLRDTPSTLTSSPPLRYHQCEIAGPSYRPFLPLLDIPNGADSYPMQPPDIWDDPSPESMQVDHDYISTKAADPSTGHNTLSPLSTPSISPSTPPPILTKSTPISSFENHG
ncbi:uncharacterized protein LACBIDRAFT_315407 [Laccaria bicolor S238N-H82]|uniref:Predicted protein n=1 Tax=Laccaria bicolor (strain S238N-H82 / ATCC MYA-4686) TaxID=486041 RepID=B0D2B6_LACBS|nr:uncharacterized protein LACBIDRAFT_315407 [Laccaria bicolor S238N-H82]EDR10715.1 predicted protein [Laccaria bicolor S238N-H82]|eukprot:XP_001878016.1 predicted protein [Laccaria bicolor S238N-H82]